MCSTGRRDSSVQLYMGQVVAAAEYTRVVLRWRLAANICVLVANICELVQSFVYKLYLMRVGAGVTPVSRCEQALNIEQLSPGAFSSFVNPLDCWPRTLPCIL